VEVSSFTLNGNDTTLTGAQRSRVTNLVVVFDQAVSLDPNAFIISLHSNVTVDSIPGQTAGTVPTMNLASGDGKTWIITFSGNGVDAGGSIADGVYDITIDHTKVKLVTSPSTTMAADYTSAFHRLFGDLNGDGVVNALENGQFRNVFTLVDMDPNHR